MKTYQELVDAVDLLNLLVEALEKDKRKLLRNRRRQSYYDYSVYGSHPDEVTLLRHLLNCKSQYDSPTLIARRLKADRRIVQMKLLYLTKDGFVRRFRDSRKGKGRYVWYALTEKGATVAEVAKKLEIAR